MLRNISKSIFFNINLLPKQFQEKKFIDNKVHKSKNAFVGSRLMRMCAIQTLAFTVLTVFLASIAMICGGACSAWQWWVSAIVILALPFIVETRRVAVLSGLSFITIVLGMVWICLVNFDPTWIDNNTYHLPGTRLLIQGWNPLYVSTPENIEKAFAISPTGMTVFHVLAVQKAVWIFNAVATLFHGHPLAITFPAGYFIFVAFALFVFSELNEHRILKLALVWLIWHYSFNASIMVDTVVGISGIGLILAMKEAFSDFRTKWPYLLGFSFWMMNAKTAGALACFAMWLVFSGFILGRYRKQWKQILLRLLVCGGVLLGCFIVSCASPYIAMYREYKHPFYPTYTVDDLQFPKYSLIADLDTGNDDYNAMGGIGRFVNVYVSPGIAQWYYNWRLGRTDFYPINHNWYCAASDNGEPTETCPTTAWFRFKLCGSMCILLLMPGCRFFACALLLALAFAPSECYGYARYFPWIFGFEVLAFLTAFFRCIHKYQCITHLIGTKFILLCFLLFVAIVEIPRYVMASALVIDQKIQVLHRNPELVFANVSGQAAHNVKTKNLPVDLEMKVRDWMFPSEQIGKNSIILLTRMFSPLQGTDVVGIPIEELVKLYKNPLGFYEKNEIVLEINKYNVGGTRLKRLVVNYPLYASRMLTVGLMQVAMNCR